MSENNDAWDDWETAADAGLADFNKPISSPHTTTPIHKGGTNQSNAKLWDQANEYATPTIIRTDTIQTQYQPEIKILKRSKDTSQYGGRPNATNGATRIKTLEEREKEYRLARQRIFKQEEKPTNSKDDSGKKNINTSG